MAGARGARLVTALGCCSTWRSRSRRPGQRPDRANSTANHPETESMLSSIGLAPSTTCFIILGLVVALFIWNRLPIGIVAIGAALSLWATGILTLNDALAGFGDPVVLFIAALFIVSEALDSTGVTTWAGQQLIARVGSSQNRLLLLTMLLAAALSAVISPNGAVAALV